MSSCIDTDLEFHGTKKGQTAKTRRKAYQGKALIIKHIDVLPFIRTLSSADSELLIEDRTSDIISKLEIIYSKYGKGKDLTLSFR